MSTPAKQRLMKDMKTVKTSSDGTIYAEPLEDDLMIWVAIIFGPESTSFEDGTFSLVLTFPESYPWNPPTVKFISEMFHPNIYSNGELCLDILGNNWNPNYDILSILMSIQSLLNDPNTKSPANTEAARLFSTDSHAYVKRVRESVEKSWIDILNLRQKDTKG